MNDHTRNFESGVAGKTGGTASDSFPHLCPFQERGAERATCAQFTSTLHLNIRGCCAAEYRNFEPCNSKLRKCYKCLLEGKGEKANTVVEVTLGLCSLHLSARGNPKPILRPQTQVPTLQLEVMESPKKVEKIHYLLRTYATPEQVEKWARGFLRLGLRERETAIHLLTHSAEETASIMGIGKASLMANVSALCSKLGMPMSYGGEERFDRKGAMRLVATRYLELKKAGKFDAKPAPASKSDPPSELME